MYKVEFFINHSDRLNDIKTIKEFQSFEEATDFFHSMISNHNGAVRLIHPQN